MSVPICRPCIALPCDNPPDLAAGIDAALYSQLDYSFIVQCPEHCYCPPGLFPQTISILASTIPPVIPPILEPGDQIILRLQGCSALITRTLSSNATQAEINAAAQSMQAEWAGQQALCNALVVPGVNCNTGSGTISVCNDEITFVCPYTGNTIVTPAGTVCESLNITGLNQGQIDAAVALLKANLNNIAQNQFCPYLLSFCGPTITTFPGGIQNVNILAHNVGPSNFDTSSFQLFADAGFFIGNSVTPVVAPGATGVLISVFPVALPFNVRFKGTIVYHGDSTFQSVTVTFVVCNPT